MRRRTRVAEGRGGWGSEILRGFKRRVVSRGKNDYWGGRISGLWLGGPCLRAVRRAGFGAGPDRGRRHV